MLGILMIPVIVARFLTTVEAGTIRLVTGRGVTRIYKGPGKAMEVPISTLRYTASLRLETRWLDGEGVTSYSFAYNGHLIFGATAKILQQFLELLEV